MGKGAFGQEVDVQQLLPCSHKRTGLDSLFGHELGGPVTCFGFAQSKVALLGQRTSLKIKFQDLKNWLPNCVLSA